MCARTIAGNGLPAVDGRPDENGGTGGQGFVVVANRLPVERLEAADGAVRWQRSPGGLVIALAPVMRQRGGAWVGWPGSDGEVLEPFDSDGMLLVGVALSAPEVAAFYQGFCNATLWPLYHDVIVPPEFRRTWWESYLAVNARFAAAVVGQAGAGASVWVHDYQLQLVPAMLRRSRPDLRIGFFNHIPFPGYELFAQLPWRRQIVEGLLGADLIGFQRQGDVSNFLRACRRAAKLPTRGAVIGVADREQAAGAGPPRSGRALAGVGEARNVRAGTFPISIDAAELDALARRPDVRARAREIRSALGDPRVVLLGADRLDYTKGILHRLAAYGELLDSGQLTPSEAVLVQAAGPTRERVDQYMRLREEVEAVVGRINGNHATLGRPAVHYLHHSYPREEMAALYVAADVMLVTPLRDGMNLVAKEYVACRFDERGTLILSEFTGAADELGSALLVNPHDIEGVKEAIVRAVRISPREAQRRMRSMRKRIREHDVHRWASSFLDALATAPGTAEPQAGP